MQVSVLILTTNRQAEVFRCLRSLALIKHLVTEILLLDNAGDQPIDAADLPEVGVGIKIVRETKRQTCLAGRNRLASLAAGEALLIIDDDAYLINDTALARGITLMSHDHKIGAVAFAQCDAAGNLPAGYGQSAPTGYECYTCSFGGYAALIRKSVFLALGGFQELLQGYGEEQELCKRLWDKGFSVVWTPLRSFVHAPSESGRDYARIAQLKMRNSWLLGLLIEPLPFFVASIPLRLKRHLGYATYFGNHQNRPRSELVASSLFDAAKCLPTALARRSPVSYRTLLRWERLKKHYPAYLHDSSNLNDR